MLPKFVSTAFSGGRGQKIVDAVVRVIIMFAVKEALYAVKNTIKKFKKRRKKKRKRNNIGPYRPFF